MMHIYVWSVRVCVRVDLLATVCGVAVIEWWRTRRQRHNDIITRSLPKSLGDFCFDGRGGSGRAVSRIGPSPRPEVRGCGGGGGAGEPCTKEALRAEMKRDGERDLFRMRTREAHAVLNFRYIGPLYYYYSAPSSPTHYIIIPPVTCAHIIIISMQLTPSVRVVVWTRRRVYNRHYMPIIPTHFRHHLTTSYNHGRLQVIILPT